MNNSLYLTRAGRSVRWFCLASLFVFSAWAAMAQTAFLNFNTVGQYTNNFNPWNDTGAPDANGGVYSFEENTTNGVGGSGGIRSGIASSESTAAVSSSRAHSLATRSFHGATWPAFSAVPREDLRT